MQRLTFQMEGGEVPQTDETEGNNLQVSESTSDRQTSIRNCSDIPQGMSTQLIPVELVA